MLPGLGGGRQATPSAGAAGALLVGRQGCRVPGIVELKSLHVSQRWSRGPEGREGRFRSESPCSGTLWLLVCLAWKRPSVLSGST